MEIKNLLNIKQMDDRFEQEIRPRVRGPKVLFDKKNLQTRNIGLHLQAVSLYLLPSL